MMLNRCDRHSVSDPEFSEDCAACFAFKRVCMDHRYCDEPRGDMSGTDGEDEDMLQKTQKILDRFEKMNSSSKEVVEMNVEESEEVEGHVNDVRGLQLEDLKRLVGEASPEELVGTETDDSRSEDALELPKLKRMNSGGSARSPEEPPPMPALLKIPDSEKEDWNIEYLDEEDGDLDKILSTAEQVNADNFTKAMKDDKESPKIFGIKVKTVENINEGFLKETQGPTPAPRLVFTPQKVSTRVRQEKQTEPIRVIPYPPPTTTPPLTRDTLSLYEFAEFAKPLLPKRWLLQLDEDVGLQILTTHLDHRLNPSLLISLVVSFSGQITLNVRGQQLEDSHPLFSSLRPVTNSKNRISIPYLLDLIDRLHRHKVCAGCSDLAYKKYWSDNGYIDYYTEFQQTYRSQHCELIVAEPRARCGACQRTQEALRKRMRKERQMGHRAGQQQGVEGTPNNGGGQCGQGAEPQDLSDSERKVRPRGEADDGLEAAFEAMRRDLAEEVRTRSGWEREGEQGREPQTQEVVLGWMGLTRRDKVDQAASLRKSKREKRVSCKVVPPNTASDTRCSVDEELEFLETHWHDLTTLFTTSLLCGAYSRTSEARLRDHVTVLGAMLQRWCRTVTLRPSCVGADTAFLATFQAQVGREIDPMELTETELRATMMRFVKEVNRLKDKLRAKNDVFRRLHHRHVKRKPRLARPEGPDTAPDDGGAPGGLRADTPQPSVRI